MRSKPSGRDDAHTEATRLLCAGAWLKADFRHQVVAELIGQAHRPVAPAFGVDVLPVLAHALRAVREETRTAALMLAVWTGFYLTEAVMLWDTEMDDKGWTFWTHGLGVTTVEFLTSPLPTLAELLQLLVPFTASNGPQQGPGLLFGSLSWPFAYAFVVFLLWLTRLLAGGNMDMTRSGGMDVTGSADAAKLPGQDTTAEQTRAANLARLRRRSAGAVRLYAWLAGAVYVLSALVSLPDDPFPLLFPLLFGLVVWRHQVIQREVLSGPLSRRAFADSPVPPLPAAYAAIGEQIHREQQASLTLYDVRRPFVGVGAARNPWLVVLPLQPRAASAQGKEPTVPGATTTVPEPSAPPRGETRPMTAHKVIEMMRPRLEALRDSAAATSKDRLRHVEIEEFVYLPSGVGRDEPLDSGDGKRPQGIFEPDQVERHRAASVGEGGEARRHFLRVRVGAWDEQVVVSLLVGVHTQGRMLVLEVVPHVLGPIAPEFREGDALAERAPHTPLRAALLALANTPTAVAAICVGALRTLRLELRRRQSPPELVAPDAPRISLRELAGTNQFSLLQEMDVTRYIRTIQDRIGEGVRDALHEAGYRTDRLEQNITHVNGGVFIGEMSGGAVATGSHGSATSIERGSE